MTTTGRVLRLPSFKYSRVLPASEEVTEKERSRMFNAEAWVYLGSVRCFTQYVL